MTSTTTETKNHALPLGGQTVANASSTPAGVGALAGFSLSHDSAAGANQIKRRSSANIIRPDYHKKPLISYGEAADMAGVSVKTIYQWVCAGRRGKRLPLARRLGAYRIDQAELRRYLEG
jgi:predicted DNA-binding transcriptional regulator AlpA